MRDRRNYFFHQLNALAGKFGHESTHAGYIAARPRQAGDNAHTERLSDRCHHNGERFSRSFRCLRCRRAAGDDQIHAKPHQLGRQPGKTTSVTVG